MTRVGRALGAVLATGALLALSACGGDSGGGGSSARAARSRSSPGGPRAARRPASTPWSRSSTSSTRTSEFVNGAVAGGAGSDAKNVLASRLQTNDPPDTFQAHAGAELTDYIDDGQIEDLSSMYEDNGLERRVPRQACSSGCSRTARSTRSRPTSTAPTSSGPTRPSSRRPGIDPDATYDTWTTGSPTWRRSRTAGSIPLSVGDRLDPGAPARDRPAHRPRASRATTGSGTGRPTGPARGDGRARRLQDAARA